MIQRDDDLNRSIVKIESDAELKASLQEKIRCLQIELDNLTIELKKEREAYQIINCEKCQLKKDNEILRSQATDTKDEN